MSDLSRKRVKQKRARRRRAKYRIRSRLAGTSERPRLSVHKSLRYVYAQLIDDSSGTTLVSASSLEPSIRGELEGTGNRTAARLVGKKVAERAKEKGVERVVFDRGGFVYHGKVREVAEGAREAGLEL